LEIIPSVDISKGRCVKRVRGVEGTGLEVGDPVETALHWESEGATRLHVVDLDAAASGKLVNREVVEKILKEVSIPVQVGGGIRDFNSASYYLERGASWIVLGTGILEKSGFLVGLLDVLGSEKIIAALDYSSDGFLVKRGWTAKTDVKLLDFAQHLDGFKLAAFLCTYTSLEGTMEGVDADTMNVLTRTVETPVIYAGGVRSLEDLVKLKKAGVSGVVLGMALYSGSINLKEAMEVCK